MRDAGSRQLRPAPGGSRRILRLCAVLSLLATVCVALARSYWFFELFSHFRVQLIALQLALLIVFALTRQPAWALTLALACVINGAPVREYLLPVGASPAALIDESPLGTQPAGAPPRGDARGVAPARIRIASANVLATNPDAAALIGVLRSADPDVFAVLELTEPFMRSLANFTATYPHRVLLPEPGTFGIAVYSRWPLGRADVLNLEGVTAIDVLVAGNGSPWHFVAVHLVPPMSRELAARRNAQLRKLAEHVRSLEAPHVVVGDFNLSPYSPHFGDFLEGTQLSSTLLGRGPRLTWPSTFPLLGIPIDHVLASREFAVSGYFRAGDVGSDHYPIIVDLNRRRLALD